METPAQQTRLIVTAQKFIEILGGKNQAHKPYLQKWEPYQRAIVINGISVQEEIVIPMGFQTLSFPIVLTNSRFKNIRIEGGDFLGDFRIELNNEFENFSISDGKFHSMFLIAGDAQFNVFRIEGGEFTGDFRIAGGDYLGEFEINRGSFLKDFSISSGNFRSIFWIYGDCVFNNLIITYGTFENTFHIEAGKFFSEISIEGGEFKRQCIVSSKSKVNDFFIKGGSYKEGFLIEDGNFTGYFKIENGIFNKEFAIIKGVFLKDFEITGGIFLANLKIDNARFSTILIRSKEEIFVKTFQFSILPAMVSMMKLVKEEKNFIINTLRFQNLTLQQEEVIQLDGLHVNETIFSHVLNYGNITLTAVKAESTYQVVRRNGIIVTRNGSRIEKKPDSPAPQLAILSSDLGKTTWIGCDFGKAELRLTSSKLTDMFVTGTQFPTRITNTNPEQRRLGYGQLKKVYENRGDSTRANEYFARQMNAYAETLTWKQDFWEKANLWLNRISTNHGQSWQRGLGMTLAISAAFFGAYLLSLRICPGTDVAYFLKVWSYSLEFINPIHDAGFVAEELSGVKETSLSRIVEGLSRIFIAYFIYQLIQAFRKHGKKGE